MTTRALVIDVRLHDGRFHGAGEWCPSPARIFQALVAAAPRRGRIDREDHDALSWLEGLPPPAVATPRMSVGQRLQAFVPNNDLDAVGGDPDRIGEVRTAKTIQPVLFDGAIPFLFAWNFVADETADAHASRLSGLAERLYQFGRGVDMAWANGRVLDEKQLAAMLRAHRGPVHRPSPGASERDLRCPHPGSLHSLETRHEANLRRFVEMGTGRNASSLFAQPPKPSFASVAYDSVPPRFLYELQRPDGTFAAWPLRRAHALVEWVRDGIAAKLQRALPGSADDIRRSIVGSKGEDARVQGRVRIMPLPSIGHRYVDRSIRRLLVEVPPECALGAADVHWAASGLDLGDQSTGVVVGEILALASDDAMLSRYGIGPGTSARTWRTITPAALPAVAARRRVEPTRQAAEAKGGAEHAREHATASSAVAQALRHAGIDASVESVRVQREPFESGEERAERFAQDTRFAKERLWHVEVIFASAVSGPVVIGDGRYLGLGVMRPAASSPTVHVFALESQSAVRLLPTGICRALRRAVMARVQPFFRGSLPTFFTGHESPGEPVRGEGATHIGYLYDERGQRLLLLAPSVLDRRGGASKEERYLRILDGALEGLSELRLGGAGIIRLRRQPFEADRDPLFARSDRWRSLTDYVVTRHPKRMTAAEALAEDLRMECARRGLRIPRVIIEGARGVRGEGLVGTAELRFDQPVLGPLVLGRTRHFGGGLFGGDPGRPPATH